jgi:integrase
MVRGPHLYRRGPVYYWQRRLPARLAGHLSLSSIRLNLGTKDVGVARRLVAALDAFAMEVFMTMPVDLLTKEQLTALFKNVLHERMARLGSLADLERQRPSEAFENIIRDEEAMGEAFKILSKEGAGATVSARRREELTAQGRDDKFIDAVPGQLEVMRKADGSLNISQEKLSEYIKEVEGTPNPSNIAKAQPVYLRAVAEALLKAADRYAVDGVPEVEYDALVAEVTSRDAALAPQADLPDHFSMSNIPISSANQQVDAAVHVPTVEPPRGDILSLAHQLKHQRVQDGSWDEKTGRQALYIFNLFARFLKEEWNLTFIEALEQSQISSFDTLLRGLHSNFGKSSKDATCTIAEIRKLAQHNVDKHGTLSGVTRNRHWMFIGQLFVYGRGQGFKVDRDLSTETFRAPKKTRGRNQRSIPVATDVRRLFDMPVFTGYAKWDDIDTRGDEFFHRGEYFCPMLAYYSGARREEYCGLTVDDIITDNGHPYIHIAPSQVRRIKNEQSQRNLALHPELIRLGFLDYVLAIKALGYTRLFPDLYSPSTKSPMGDRLYDQLLTSLRNVGFTPHQIRHFFGDDLKQKDVHAEHRSDLLGHGGESETTERYCNPLRIEKQLEHILKLPAFTDQLEPRPIKIIPWVEAKEIAPWSKAAQLARKEARLAERAASGTPPRRRHKRRKPKPDKA